MSVHDKIALLTEGASAYQIAVIGVLNQCGLEKEIIDEIKQLEPAKIASDYWYGEE